MGIEDDASDGIVAVDGHHAIGELCHGIGGDIVNLVHADEQGFGANDEHLSHLLPQGHLSKLFFDRVGGRGVRLVVAVVVATAGSHHGRHDDEEANPKLLRESI